MSVLYKLEKFDIYELKNMPTGKGIPTGSVKRNVAEMLEEFINGNHDCCKLCTCEDGRKAHIEYANLHTAMTRAKLTNIRIVIRGCSVYLVKKDKWEEVNR